MNLSIPKFSMRKFSLPMFSKAQATAGLVIRPGEVELLSLQGKRVGASVRVPIAGEGAAPLTQAIEQAIAQAGLKTKRLAVSILNPEILIRFFTMPAIPKSEWEGAVQFEARKYIPFKMESLTWDFHIMHASGTTRQSAASSEKLDVVFTGFPREVFGQFQAALEAAGVQATVIEPLSLSLARLAASARETAPHDFVCLVDIRQETAHLVIAREGVPYLTRDIHLTSRTGEGLEPPADEPSMKLLSELNVSMDFFTRESPSAHIGAVVLFADESLVAPWQRDLAGQLRCQVESGARLMQGHAESGVSAVFASALGLLQAGRSRAGASLDFLRRNMAGATSPAHRLSTNLGAGDFLKSLKQPKTVMAGAAFAAVPFALCAILGGQQITTAQRHLDQLMQASRAVGMGLDGMSQDALKPIQENAQKQLTFLQQLMDQRAGAAAKLDALARSLPDGVWITAMTFEDRIDLSGKSMLRLDVNGACFLGGHGEEVSAIQTFERRVKDNAALFKGFQIAQLGQISAQTDLQRQAVYRTFQLNCRSDRRM